MEDQCFSSWESQQLSGAWEKHLPMFLGDGFTSLYITKQVSTILCISLFFAVFWKLISKCHMVFSSLGTEYCKLWDDFLRKNHLNIFAEVWWDEIAHSGRPNMLAKSNTKLAKSITKLAKGATKLANRTRTYKLNKCKRLLLRESLSKNGTWYNRVAAFSEQIVKENLV